MHCKRRKKRASARCLDRRTRGEGAVRRAQSNGIAHAPTVAGGVMTDHSLQPKTVTVTAVADGLAYVYGRVVADRGAGSSRWEYLGSTSSRDEALAAARRS